MQSFLEEVVGEVILEGNSLENTVFVLPSKRAGTFLKTILARQAQTTFFAPEIYSTETFVEEVSQLTYAGTIDQLFALYESYRKQDFDRKDDFNTFCKWGGQTLLQDFNEVDRYLIDTEELFTNLSAIQELNHWSLQADKTKMMEDYLKFWNSLERIYRDFCHILTSKGLGHQGWYIERPVFNLKSILPSMTNEDLYLLASMH